MRQTLPYLWLPIALLLAVLWLVWGWDRDDDVLEDE